MNMAEKRTNVIPIIEDARHPAKYRMLVGMVDIIFSDVNHPEQANILSLNASYFLKSGGHFMISIKVCNKTFLTIDSNQNHSLFSVHCLVNSKLLVSGEFYRLNNCSRNCVSDGSGEVTNGRVETNRDIAS